MKAPFVASGGIADGKQMAAAMALGADGVNMGTRFCATKECPWPESFKQRMIEADERQTVLMFRSLHNTARTFRNKVSSEVERIEKEKGKDLVFADIRHLVSGKRGRQAQKDDDPDGGIWGAGQCVGLVDSIPTVDELLKEFVAEAEVTIKHRLAGIVGSKI